MTDAATRVAERWANMPSTPVVYAGVFLPPMSKQRLLRAFPAEHPTVFAHHLTVWHFLEGGDMPELPWGKTVDLKVVGHFNNNHIQAVVVDPPTRLRQIGRTPHITLSAEPGVGPVESNRLVPSGADLVLVRGLTGVKGVVGWVGADEKVHFTAPGAQS